MNGSLVLTGTPEEIKSPRALKVGQNQPELRSRITPLTPSLSLR